MMLKLKKGISIKFKKEDVWIGVYWDQENIWICLIPCFPIWIIRNLTKHSKCLEGKNHED